MNESERRLKIDLAVRYAMQYVGRFYTWGGDDPSGFDCSGFVCEILASVGRIGRKEDLSAAGLFDRFKDHIIPFPKTGSLSFHRNADGEIVHVEFCIDGLHTIAASGGGSKTVTIADAIRDNAFIKIRPVSGQTCVDPFQD